MRRPARLLASLALALLGPGRAQALGPPGDFRVVGGQTDVEVSSWGPDCGPRPESGPEPTGAVYDLDASGDLRPRGGAAPLASPGVCAARSGVREVTEVRRPTGYACQTPATAAKRAEGTIALAARGTDALRVTARLRFDWILKGSTCRVDLRTTHELTRATPLAPAPDAGVERCPSPGPAERLTVVGQPRRVGRLGARLRLGVRARDSADCETDLPATTWTTTAGRVASAGEGAAILDLQGVEAGATLTVTAQAGPLEVGITVRVLGDVAYAAEAAADPALVEGELAPLPPQAGSALDAVAPPAVRAGRGRAWLALFLGLCAVVVGLGVSVAWRSVRDRRAGARRADEALGRLEEATREPAKASPVPALPSEDTETWHTSGADPDPEPEARGCPVCERSFSPDVRFCPYDGRELDAHPTPEAEPEPRIHGPRERVCPRCGAHYPEDSIFCGVDGERLLLLN